MAPKNKHDEKKGSNKKFKKFCGKAGPGPIYKLKTVVGYDDHCYSKLRNPAYSMAFRQTDGKATCGPGPKYLVVLPGKPGFSFGHRMNSTGIKCSPGPYMYDILNCNPKFSIKSKTPYRSGSVSPGPYSLPDTNSSPVFTMGKRPSGGGCSPSPGPYTPYEYPKTPAFSMSFKQSSNNKCDGPGPVYYPKLLKKSPEFSFGLKHSECSPPLITECDDKC